MNELIKHLLGSLCSKVHYKEVGKILFVGRYFESVRVSAEHGNQNLLKHFNRKWHSEKIHSCALQQVCMGI